MLKNVKITEKRSNVVIAKYPIMFGNPHFTEREFFDEAWVSSIEDGLVSPDNKKSIRLKLQTKHFKKIIYLLITNLLRRFFLFYLLLENAPQNP